MKKKLKELLKTLGFAEKAKLGGLSAEEITTINAECQKQFKMTFQEALIESGKNEKELETLAEEHQNILKSLYDDETPEVSGTSAPEGEKAKDPVKKVEELKSTIKAQEKKIEILEAEPEKINPKKVAGKGKVISIKGGAHTEKYIYGIEAPLFDMRKPWNAVTATRQPLEIIAASKGLNTDWDEYREDFKKEVVAYGKSLAGRMGQLQAENRLHTIKMQDIDFTGFDDTGWGEEYVIRRQDALIAYIRTLDSISVLFPVRYGVQNKEVLTNAFLTHFSAAYQTGHYFKGATSVEPLEAQVYDLMIKHKFTNMKQLEKEYIGYLNKEGSDPMKFTWVEWVLARILEVAMNEWNERRILGVRIEPTAGTLGHHLHGSDGLFEKLWKYSADFRLKPFTGYGYTSSTMLTAVESFVAAVYAYLPSLTGLRLYVNKKHIPWYKALYRTAYGANLDFTGAKLTVMNYEDVEIIGVPNMGRKTSMILTAPGNIECYENLAGEMAKIGTQRDLEELIIYSYWKEGIGAYMVGKKFASAILLAADNYQNQYIFFTDDTVELAAHATTCDGTKGDRFITVANGQATVITDITSPTEGVVYKIILGSTSNGTTINKSGNFSSIASTWTPTAVGDFLRVYWDATAGKFIEVDRLVTS
jgi:hypothetical protein